MFTPSTKPKIRQRTVTVKKAPDAQAHGNGATKTGAAPPADRYKLSSSSRSTLNKTTSQSQSQSRQPARRSLAVSSRVTKRKTTESPMHWGSSDSSSDSDQSDRDRLSVNKRQKTRLSNSTEPTTLNRSLEPDYDRRIRIRDAEEGENVSPAPTAAGKSRLVHGQELCEVKKEFKPAFKAKESLVVSLQYPSRGGLENFETVIPTDEKEGYHPLRDIYWVIEEMIHHYLPEHLSEKLSSDYNGPVSLLKRAVSKNEPEDFRTALEDFNKLIRENLDNGTIAKVMDSKHALPLSLIKHITSQSYQRTISPIAHLLKRNILHKATTYGELLTPFVHKLFQQTALKSSSVFVDLGSGVGNVVVQAALETGAESWGIEVMETPAKHASLQAAEMRARARLWNIAIGDINLFQGSFFESPEIDDVLRRADVVLVNNKVFGQKINNQLLEKFLDLKLGCRVVSLESFGGGSGNKQGVRNEQSIAGLFDEDNHHSGTNSVSWTGDSVEYFIATKAR